MIYNLRFIVNMGSFIFQEKLATHGIIPLNKKFSIIFPSGTQEKSTHIRFVENLKDYLLISSL